MKKYKRLGESNNKKLDSEKKIKIFKKSKITKMKLRN